MDCSNTEKAWHLAYAAGKRFDGDYIEERRNIETWMRAEAAFKGLMLPDVPPLYFRLYPQPVTTPEKGSIFINLSADTVSTKSVTFTIEDSFHNYAQLCGRPNGDFGITPRVLTVNEIISELDENNFPEHLDGRETGRYIEAQLWRRDEAVLRLIQRCSIN